MAVPPAALAPSAQPRTPPSVSAVERFVLFALMGVLPVDVVGKRVSNYHIWFSKLKKAFDPNGVGEQTGFSYVGADASGAHTTIYQPEAGKAAPKR